LFGEDSRLYKYMVKQDSELPLPPYANGYSSFQLHPFEEWIRRHVTEPQEKSRQERTAKERQNAELNKQLEQAKVVIRIALKHGIEDDDAYEVLNAITAKDKYLALALDMMRCREYGYDYYDAVVRKVNSFPVVTATDTEIVNDLRDCISRLEDDVFDGRYFRDTKWGYSALFELADKDLTADAMTLYEMERNY
jgi:hypothetical protein